MNIIIYYICIDQSKIFPTETTLCIGSKTTLYCASHGRTTWTHTNHYGKKKIYTDHHSSFTVKGSDLREGYYDCEGVDVNSKSFIARALVEVEGNYSL